MRTTRSAELIASLLVAPLLACAPTTTQAPPETTAEAGKATPPGAPPPSPAQVVVRRAEGAPSETEIRRAVERAFAAGQQAQGGEVADYIPALARVDPDLYGLAVVTVDGQVYTMGDTDSAFSIQSVAKPFTLARLIEEIGAEAIEERIGVDATGMPFNSIMAIEMNEEHRAGNPLVNPGAIASVSMIPAEGGDQRWQKIIRTYNAFAGRPLEVDQEVYRSESETNTRNRSISWLLANYEVIDGDPLEALDLYTRQGSVAVTARDLAVMGATLANGGVNPVTGERVVDAETAERVLAVMMTAGLYEDSGTWAYRVGIPAKSGVGGGIVGAIPGVVGIGTFAPALDEAGNSVRGQRAIQVLVEELGGSVFSAGRPQQVAPRAR